MDLPLFAYDIPVCVHRKLGIDLLMKLGREGVVAGVKDSSNDDVAFRLLIRENARAGHPLQLFTGHEVVVDGSYLGGADGSVPGLANVDPLAYVEQWNASRDGKWRKVSEIQDYLADLMRITSVVDGVSGFGAGVGAFKTALRLLGIFESNQMPRPVEALRGENVDRIRKVLLESGLLQSADHS